MYNVYSGVSFVPLTSLCNRRWYVYKAKRLYCDEPWLTNTGSKIIIVVFK